MSYRGRWLATGVLVAALTASPVMASTHGDRMDPVSRLGVAAASTITTVLALPFKIGGCAATVGLAGVGYGVTVGSSELVEEELLTVIPEACNPRFFVTPWQIEDFADN